MKQPNQNMTVFTYYVVISCAIETHISALFIAHNRLCVLLSVHFKHQPHKKKVKKNANYNDKTQHANFRGRLLFFRASNNT